ncbi:CRISPR-associated endonuclease Cas3'' [Paracoccus luteus]|uniref:CRISPR-associated endonuclease Cas3'' n=1 Tax=Paracoccus luteus TaxID=2508543 RepID=UPI0010701E22|nr:CRISPR-associated endonuclease Cas3'' [Paracoccus luteus]
MPIHAHSLPGRPETEWETLQQHAERVADGAARRADVAGLGAYGRLLGLVHDIGKIKPAFQARLRGSPLEVSHSGEGARLLQERGGAFGCMLAGAVAGHHGRLPNPDRLRQRIAAAERLDLPDWLFFEMPPPPERLLNCGPDRARLSFRAQFLVRFLYGCLTDADDRETAAWESAALGLPDAPPRPTALASAMRDDLNRHVAGLAADGPVNALRAQVLAHVRGMAAERPGLFTLTVPTGGGKTLASLGFALDHAAAHGMTRLVHVAPFTSIVEQTAAVFRRVLGEDAVLEHHSAFDLGGEDESEREQRRVAGASWDSPVVVTTAVQFFESLFAARKKRCRKLPALARAVIVVDEAQTMPRGFLRPCLAALTELAEGYGATVVLCTATQPALTVEAGFRAPEALKGARELAPDPPMLHAALKRVRVRDLGPQSDEELAARLRTARQALLIVDNRMQARRLFDAVTLTEGAVHLSTLMTAAHRRQVLAIVRERLKARQPVRLVSTSLVEAGVDVDFPLVMRAAAGIDSLAQAAGRCNREGRMEALGELLVFQSDHPAPPVVEDYAAKGRAVLERFLDDPLSPAAVSEYFRTLWHAWGDDALDSAEVGETAKVRGILRAIEKAGLACPFEDIERAFRLIGDEQKAVIVRDGDYGVSQALLDELQWSSPGTAARALQSFTVNVPFRLWRDLWAAGVLAWWQGDRFGEQFALLEAPSLYHERAGLAVEGLGDIGTMLA